MCVYPQAERAHPGLCQEFIAGVLDAEGVSINLPEALLRLACHDYEQYIINSEEPEFVQLNFKAKGLCVSVYVLGTEVGILTTHFPYP